MPLYNDMGEMIKQGIKVETISSGLYHSLVLTDDGEVYSWGQGRFGAIGTGSRKDVFEP